MILFQGGTLAAGWTLDGRRTRMEMERPVRSLLLKDNFDSHLDSSSDRGEKQRHMGFVIILGDNKANRLTNKLDVGCKRHGGRIFSF